MNQENIAKITFDRKEAAQKLGISVVTLDRELAKNRLPHFRVGRRVLFTQELLEKYIQQNTQNVVIRRS
jgi:excisionase family DNA binding protein